MKKIFSFLSFFILFNSCNNTGKENETEATIKKNARNVEIKKIDSLEKILRSHQSLSIPLGNAMIRAYGSFASSYPEDSLAPEYLFKAADIAQGMQKGDIAYTYYQKIHSHYPTYKKARLSLFLQGYVSENQLGDTAMALHIYREIIKTRPYDNLSMQARACIQNIGKSPEEMVKEFEKMNKAKN